MEALTVAGAVAELEKAIELGDLIIQQVPGGHPLFAALDKAKEVLWWINDQAPSIPSLAAVPKVRAAVEQAINGLDMAIAAVRRDPDQPLTVTLWPRLKQLPWPWIAGGVGAAVLVAVLVRRRQAA